MCIAAAAEVDAAAVVVEVKATGVEAVIAVGEGAVAVGEGAVVVVAVVGAEVTFRLFKISAARRKQY